MPDLPAARHLQCGLCGSLHDQEYAVQHVQGDEDDTVLPDAVSADYRDGRRSEPLPGTE